MNKKLFALLATAAMMATMAPSVFAVEDGVSVEGNESQVNEPTESQVNEQPTESQGEQQDPVNPDAETLTLSLTTSATKAAAGDEVTFDVLIDSAVPVDGVEFNFTAENAELVSFVPNDTVVNDILKWDTISVDLDSAKHVLAWTMDFDGVAPSNAVLGTLTVKVSENAKDGDLVTVGTTSESGTYNDEELVWKTNSGTVIVGEPDSEASKNDSESSNTSASESSKTTSNTSSKSGTNGTTNNTNTGAASTAAVALAASAAALVVISKKRK